MTHALARLAASIRNRSVTAHEAAAHALAAAAAVPNAVVYAATQDDIAARIAALPQGAPFAGVPILIKDTAPEAGRPLTLGSRTLPNHVPRDTDGFVQALTALGFVSIGRTATPEFGLTDATEPVTTGPVANPWGATLSPGGSSGGAAAIVAAGAIPFAHGGDGGGSLRAPAARCGLVGLKPTRGSLRPSPTPLEPWMPVLGESFGLTPDVGSTAAVFASLRGEAEITAPPPRRLRIAVIDTPLHGGPPDADMTAALHGTVALLETLGHHPIQATWPFDAPALHAAFFDLWALRTHLDLARFSTIFGRPLDRTKLECWTLGLDGLGARMTNTDRTRIDTALRTATATLPRLLESCDVLITPATGRARLLTGAHHGNRDFQTLRASIMDQVAHTPLHNLAGTPAIALPLATTNDSTPIGLQFAARQGWDAVLLALGLELEAAHPFPRPPKLEMTPC
jgi:amidase